MKLFIRVALGLMITANVTFPQAKANLRGVITDELGAVIAGAMITVTDAEGNKQTAATDLTGTYSFTALKPGKYTVSAIALGLAASDNQAVEVAISRRESLTLL